MKSLIHIGKNFELPRAFARERFAVLGQSGSGKTNLVYVVFEALVHAGVQVILLDPPGVGWGLTLDRKGKANDLPVIVLGGQHGDIPIVSGRGREIADLVMDRRISVVVDLTAFDTEDEQRRFCRDFIRQIHRRKISAPGALHVIFDEVQDLAPAEPESKDHAALKGTVVRFCKQIRNYGAGWTIASQQPQAVHYSVRSQASAVFALHTENEGDFAAILRTINRKKDEIKPGDLEALPIGSALVYCPRALGREIRKVEILYRDTFDVPKAAEGSEPMPTSARRLDAKELEQLRGAVSATVAEAERNDPTALQRRIADLEIELKRATSAPAPAPAAPPKVVEKRILAPGQLERLEKLGKELQRQDAALAERLTAMDKIAQEARQAGLQLGAAVRAASAPAGFIEARLVHRGNYLHVEQPVTTDLLVGAPKPIGTGAKVTRTADGVTVSFKPTKHFPHNPPLTNGHSFTDEDGAQHSKLSRRQIQMLGAIVGHHEPSIRLRTLGSLIGMSHRGGGFSNVVSSLSAGGLLERQGGRVAITAEGTAAIGGKPPEPSSIADVLARWRSKLPAKVMQLVEHCVTIYPRGATMAELAELVNMAERGGGFSNLVSKARARGLLVGKGAVTANPTVFPGLERAS